MPFWFVVAYFVVEYLRPQDRFAFLEPLRVGLIVSVIVALVWLVKGDKSSLKEPLIRLYVVFVILVAATVFVVVNHYHFFYTFRSLIIYFLAGVMPIVAFLSDERLLRRFMKIWLGIHAVIALQSIGAGGRGPGSFLRDENDLALAITMAIPYAFFLNQAAGRKTRERIIYMSLLVLFVVAVIATHSRGGFVGLAATLFVILLLSKNRVRNILLICLVAGAIYPWIPSSYMGEIRSISDVTDSTRQERLYSWRRGWEMFLDNPILGVGADNYPWRVHEYELKSDEYSPQSQPLHGGRVAHSLYFTLLPELGIAGVLLYGAMVFLLLRKLYRMSAIGTSVRESPTELLELHLLAKAMLASAVAFLVSALFLSVLYYPHFWYLIGFATALERALGKALHQEPGGLQLPSASRRAGNTVSG